MNRRQANLQRFRVLKYGFFVHYVWGGPDKKLSIRPDGSVPASFDEAADGFDVKRFADDIEAWGVEYVLFTAWHAGIYPLYPSKVMPAWGLPDHACGRHYDEAVLWPDGKPLALTQDAQKFRVILPETSEWAAEHTVIRLKLTLQSSGGARVP